MSQYRKRLHAQKQLVRFTDLPLLPTAPGLDPFVMSPYEWQKHCWKSTPPMCPECGRRFVRPDYEEMKVKGKRLRRIPTSRRFCCGNCFSRYTKRITQCWVPKEYRNVQWEGRDENPPRMPPELQWIKDVWSRQRDTEFRDGQKALPYDSCGAICSGFPTNSYPLRHDVRGQPCPLPAGMGTDHVGYGKCMYHGGHTAQSTIGGQRERIRQRIEEDSRMYGTPIETTPEEAIMHELYRTAGHVAFLQRMVDGLDQEELREWAKAGWKANTWVDMYQNERDRLVVVAKTAASMGIQERQIRIAEEQGRKLANVFRAFLQNEEMGFTPEQLVKSKSVLRQLFMNMDVPALPQAATVVDAHVIQED